MRTYKTTIVVMGEIDHEPMEVETRVTVGYTCVPFCRGSTDGRYGPKIEPDEPAHIEIDWVKLDDGRHWELTEQEEEAILAAIAELEDERSE